MLNNSGNENSSLIIQLARELKLPVVWKEYLRICAFRRNEEDENDVHQLRIRSKQHPQTLLDIEVLPTNLSSMSLQDPSNFQKITKFMDQCGCESLGDSSPNNKKISIQRGGFTKLGKNLFFS
ncbi:hypothetical protein CDAR_21241 [Caerostris darwini]|uniref:Uncharacterized protein n=1 Tax=Caerostris darwini TaxID=1538125 RepID=A0AAV4W1W0_9ARAC|nr:hypothetical protein CDAR_21241 [Caerostris darwini]